MRNFKNPPKEFRPAPFWAWNDELRPSELAWQIAEMADKGFGGYFMHARVGLATAFLGSEWMRATAACVRAGRRARMQSWLYDEDKWPSGYAGGFVTRDHPERAAKRLEEDLEPVPGRSYIASFELEEGRRRYRRLSTGKCHRRSFLGYRVASGTNLGQRHPQLEMINGQPYSDLLDEDVVKAFLRISYDPYAKRFRKSFGEFLPGIFTDEPHVWRYGSLPWTGRLLEVFSRWNGYDLLDHLPDLYHDTPGAAQTRHDFWRTIGRLYREAFSRKLYERCERLGLQLTGHYLHETPLAIQARCSGAVMPLYRYEHMPGIDHLGRHNGDTMDLRQVVSAAAQCGKKRILCEIFGCSGHSMTFEDQKWLCDLHFACGVNFINPHLTLYTMKGDAKRDYPPTLSYHQPWWRHYRGMNDYIARCSVAVAAGVPCAEILVLHPISSVWCHLRARDEAPGAQKLDRALSALIHHLDSIQRDFHFGDEVLLEELASVRGEVLRVGKMSYPAVIVPPSLTWSSTTLRLLREFRGPILFVGEVPRLVDARGSGAWGELLERGNVRHIPLRRSEIERALDAALLPDVSVKAKPGERSALRYHHRRKGKTQICFLANLSRTRSAEVTLRLRAKGDVRELDPRTGEVRPLPSRVVGALTVVETVLPPVGSRLFEVRPGKPREARPEHLRDTGRKLLRGPFPIQRTHPNAATLDCARARIGEGPRSARLPLFRVRQRIYQHFGFEDVREIQPWVFKERGFAIRREELSLLYDFHVIDLPARIAFAMECSDRWRLRVNGRRVPSKPLGFFVDKQFGTIDITSFVRAGDNVVEAVALYDWDLPIEDAYLVGDFAVRMTRAGRGFTLVRETPSLRIGDWTAQGYPFYSGNMIYRASLRVDGRPEARHFVRLRFEGTLACVRVNGVECPPIVWAPWESEVTEALRKGENELAIEVCSSLRNTMGPLHNRLNRALMATGPKQFSDPAQWTDAYQFEPYGLMGAVEVIRRRRLR